MYPGEIMFVVGFSVIIVALSVGGGCCIRNKHKKMQAASAARAHQRLTRNTDIALHGIGLAHHGRTHDDRGQR